MIQLLAFVTGLRRPLPDGVDAVAFGDVVAVVGEATDEPLQQGLAVQELLERVDAVLPARFGERFRDVEALADAVEAHVEELGRRLRAVAGCVEIAVRVGRPAAADDREADGAAYMRRRLRALTAETAAATELHSRLQHRARSAAVVDPALSRLLHDACYLVERGAVDDFAGCVSEFADAHPELSLVCTGPWAPASFAEAPA